MRITESQLRRVVKRLMKEQGEQPAASTIPVASAKGMGVGRPTYGHTEIGTSFAPQGMSEEDAVKYLRDRFTGAPMWKFGIYKDKDTGGIFAYYEIDNSD